MADLNGSPTSTLPLDGQKRPFSIEFKLLMAVLVPAVLIIGLYKLLFSDVDLQGINMRIAEEKLPQVQAILDADKRFKDVTVFVYTGQNGAVGLQGMVAREEDLFRLMKAIAAERLSVAIYWRIQVFKENPGPAKENV